MQSIGTHLATPSLALILSMAAGCGGSPPPEPPPEPPGAGVSGGGEEPDDLAMIEPAEAGARALKALYEVAFPAAGHLSESCTEARDVYQEGRDAFDEGAFAEAARSFAHVALSCADLDDVHDIGCRNAGVSLYNADGEGADLVATVREHDDACADLIAGELPSGSSDAQ